MSPLHPLLYSLDVFVPFVNLHQEHYWWPKPRGFGRMYRDGNPHRMPLVGLARLFVGTDHRRMAIERRLSGGRYRSDAERLRGRLDFSASFKTEAPKEFDFAS